MLDRLDDYDAGFAGNVVDEALNRSNGYLLDATTPYMLWSDECRIRCRSHLYGLLCQPEKQLAS